MDKCKFPEGLEIRPDGIHALDPCTYEEVGSYANVTIEILKCKHCGHVEIAWKRQPNTIQLEKE